METYRPKTDETFIITFSSIFSAITYDLKDVNLSAEVTGQEKDLVDYLQNNPGKIEEGLKIIEREKEVDFGFIDLFARDCNGMNTVIEVKRQQAVLADAQQLKRYIENFAKEGQKVRGILVAASIPDKVEKYLKSFKLESREIPWQEIFPTVERPKKTPKPVKLDDFFN
ncbi:MAG: endonuclease NucS domain-containing protein, partial [Candidatus Hodarchaeales archaeon]